MRTALVLPGGGARGAFQVGVLKALAEWLPRDSVNPFRIISGTSAGAVNSVVLASRAHHFRSAIAELEHVWGHFRCHHVYKTDHLTMLKSSLHWLTSIVLGGWLVGAPKSLLDNSPLRELLKRHCQGRKLMRPTFGRAHVVVRWPIPKSQRIPVTRDQVVIRGAGIERILAECGAAVIDALRDTGLVEDFDGIDGIGGQPVFGGPAVIEKGRLRHFIYRRRQFLRIRSLACQ